MADEDDSVKRKKAVERALLHGGVGDDRGETIRFRGHRWVLADIRNDGDHVHLTLTAPLMAPYQPRSTHDD